MKRCLICDDHSLVREALSGTVRMGWPDTDIEVASDFPEAWAKAATSPDLIICDLIMPGAAPVAGIDGMIRAAPGALLLVVTGTEDDAVLLELLDRGIAGFAPKSASGLIIDAAIRLILAGGRYLPPRLADIAATRFETGVPQIAGDSGAFTSDRLTGRQLDVLRLIAKGKSNKEIARSLNLAPSTVKTHLSQILISLGAANRTEASVKARRLNLI